MASVNYVAYHSAFRMGHVYSGGPDLRFSSSKPQSQLRNVINQTLWVIASIGQGPARFYLAGVYTPSTIEPEEDGWLILGTGTPFEPQVEVTGQSWFNTLYKEQNNFSFGLNRIKSLEVIEALEQLRDAKRVPPILPEELTAYSEGAGTRVTVNRYERDAAARAACLKKFGTACQVCKVTLEDIYGGIAAGLIHVHHLTPLASIGREYVLDPTRDLIPICPNCHAVAHRCDPPLSPDQIRARLEK